MTLQIVALDRGGFSARGHGWYDARANAVIAQASEGETVTLSAQFPSAINTIATELNGIETTEPSISSKTFTAALSQFRAGDQIRYDVLLSTGEMRQLTVQITGMPSPLATTLGGDYGSFVGG